MRLSKDDIPGEVEADLAKSGLTWEYVEQQGWSVIDPTEPGAFSKLKDLLGFTSYNGENILRACTSILVIPYPLSNFKRLRLYPPLNGTKYLQPAGIPPVPYILPEVAELAKKTHKPLIITEGEKKTLCLVKNGYNAIGLPGVWTFKSTKQNLSFLKELEEWDWRGRIVYICFDSDAVYNVQVLKAEAELGLNLYARGAKVFIIRLPQPDHRTKYGVDDYISEKGIDAFRVLYDSAKPLAEAYGREHIEEVLGRLVRVEMSDLLLEQLKIGLRKSWRLSVKDFKRLLGLKKAELAEQETGFTYSEEEERQAEELLKRPDILDKMLAITEKAGHIEEVVNKKILYLSAVSTKTNKAINVFIKGGSSAGKNALVEAIKALLPVKLCKKLSAVSAKALYHVKDKDLSHRVLYVAEVEGSEEADYPLRLVMSEGELSYTYPVKDPNTGEFKTIEEHIKALGTAIWQTTTRLVVTPDNENRAVDLYVDESEGLTRKIVLKQAEQINEAGNNNDLEKERRIWQCAFEKIESLPVAIPYARFLAERYPVDKIRSRRDFQKLLSLIVAHCLLYQKQRPKDKQGRLIATVDDYHEVYNLSKVVFSQTLCELSPKEEKLLKKIEERFGEDYFSIKDCKEFFKENYNTLKTYIHALAQKGYLLWSGERGAQSKYIIAKYHQEAFALPTPEEVKNYLNQASPITNEAKVSSIPAKNIGDRQITNASPITKPTPIGERVSIGEKGLTNDFSRNIGELGNIGDWLVENKEKKYEGDRHICPLCRHRRQNGFCPIWGQNTNEYAPIYSCPHFSNLERKKDEGVMI